MNQWEEKLFQLDEREKILKRLYENGGQNLVDQPMSYAQYIECLENGSCLNDELGNYYRDKSKDNLGNTVDEVEAVTEGNEIMVITHQRYSYPVMHNHAYVEILYVYCGKCVHFVEEHSFEMNTGDVCILAPNAMHAISVTSTETTVINIMVSKKLFDASFLGMVKGSRILIEFFEHVLYNKKVSPYIIFPTGKDCWMKNTVLLMYQETVERYYAFEKSLCLYMEQVFIHLIRRYEMQAIVSDPIDVSMNGNIVPVLGYISVNYNRVSLKDTASFFGYSASYLGKMIKKYTGKTYGTIISEIQMENARRLIEEDQMNITEICQEVGCFDASHLNHKFKKFYGKSPEEYKKDLKEKG